MGVVRQPPGRKGPRRTRRSATQRFLGRMRRRAARGVLGRIRWGTAAASPRLRRLALAVVLLAVVLAPYPSPGAANVAPASACRSGCRAGSVSGMIRWTSPLPGSWDVAPGLTGTVPASGLAYVSVGHGVAALGLGLTVYGYSPETGTLLWQQTLTGFPADAAIVSVRTWSGEVTAGVSYASGGRPERTEVVMSGSTGVQWGRYPAAEFGGAVAGSPASTVIVGNTAVTSYDNSTGRIRWRRSTGQVPQAWSTYGGWLYVAESAGGFIGSAPVTALRKIDLATGAESVVSPLEGFSFPGRLSAAFDGAVIFSSASGVTAYEGTTGAWLWFIRGAVFEGTDPHERMIYLTKGSNLIAVNPPTGRVTATVSGSAADGSAGMYVVRDGVALGLDQGANGDAWGYDIGLQRVTLAAAGLGWPHYFVDLSGVGGSADPSSDLVVIAACSQLTQSTTPQSPSAPAGSSAPPAVAASPSTSGTTAGPGASPSATPSAGQGCLRPELVALNL
jgi:hypothetical protein